MAQEFSATGESEPYYNFAMNVDRELLSEQNKYPILGQKAEDVVEETTYKVYELNNILLDKHLENRAIHSDRFMDKWEHIMRLDACEILDLSKYKITIEQCRLFAEGTVS